MTDATGERMCDEQEIQQQSPVTMTTVAMATVAMTTDEKYNVANELLQRVDANIVKTATLRKQMPAKCAQLLARRCRFQFITAVSLSLSVMLLDLLSVTLSLYRLC